jgi:hypothetical protein
MVTVHLYFWGWHYLDSKYPDGLMEQVSTNIQFLIVSSCQNWIQLRIVLLITTPQ